MSDQRKSKRSAAIAALAVGGALVVGSAGGAYAGHKIQTSDIAKNAVAYRKLGVGVQHKLDNAAKPGPKGDNGLKGAIYRVENYQNGGGGSATVACADDDATSQKYTAIAGGVQGSTVADQATNGFAVTSSFPGRMDWDTNTPKPNRLDGWIVLGNGKHTDTLKVWALCVPTTDIAVQTVDLDN